MRTPVSFDSPDTGRVLLAPDDPWPGLAAYDETSQAYFKGRDAETTELVRLIRTSAITVLYGSSGLGKTSLLRAGAFPALIRQDFLPVYLRAAFSLARAPLVQMAERLQEVVAESGATAPAFRVGDDLWRYLHRRDVEIWSDRNFLLTPVLVFDQFEEAFAPGADPARVRVLLDGLADLIENRVPDPVLADREQRAEYDLSSQNYRIVLSFREDFLPEFDAWNDRIPEFLRRRLRLLPMGRDTAIAAVREAGRDVLADGTIATAIVDFVASSTAEARRRIPEVEPVLLSLCCCELTRRCKPGAKIDEALLAEAGENILGTFYREALQGMPGHVSEFIEDHLVQGTRFRGNYPRDEALREGRISPEQLRWLTDVHRLLRIEDRSDVPRIELIHDLLIGVVRSARDQRHQMAREAEEARARDHEQAQRELVRERTARARELWLRHWLTALLCLLFIAVVAVGWLGEEARDQAASAKRASWNATALRLSFQSQALPDRADVERSLLQILSARRLAPSIATVDGAMLDSTLRTHDLVKLISSTSPVLAVAFSPDGTRIVSGNHDNTLRLWDAVTGQPTGAPLVGHQGYVTSVAFDPQGERIASGSWDRTVRLWDARTGQSVLAPLAGNQGFVTSVAFSPDGLRIVSGGADGTVRLWDAKTGRPIGAPTAGHQDAVWSVAFSADGARIVSGNGDRTLQVWDGKSGQPIGEPLVGHRSTVRSVAFSPDGKLMVSGSIDGTLRLWDARTGRPVGEPLAGRQGAVLSVAFSPDSTRIISGGGDKTLVLWDARSAQPIGEALAGHLAVVTGVAFSPDGMRVVSGSEDRTVRIWDAETEHPIAEPLFGDNLLVASLAYSPDGTRIVSGGTDKALRLWDAKTRQPVGEPMLGHSDNITSVAFSPDGKRIASGSADRTLRLWSVETRQPIGTPLVGHRESVTSVAFSPDGARIVSGGADKTLRLWDANSGQPIGAALAGHEAGVTSVAFSADGMRLVSGSADQTLRLWNSRTCEAIGAPLAGHQGIVTSVAFSPDGARIVSGSGDQTLRIWNARTGQSIGAPLAGHQGYVMSVAFNPAGTRLVSGSDDQTLRLWDVVSGQQFGAPLATDQGVTSVAFSPDGKHIVSGSKTKSWLWPAPDALPEILCAKLTRNMTRDQWNDWVSPEIPYRPQCPDLLTE